MVAATEIQTPLKDFQVLRLEGPDALAFAQAQFANDVQSLAVGHWQWNCYLNPQGRVIALFPLIRTGEQELLLTLACRRAHELQERLLRYRFRSRCTLSTADGLSVQGTCVPSQAGPLAPTGTLEYETQGWCLRFSGLHGRGLRIHVRTENTQTQQQREQWTIQDIEDGIPWLCAGAVEAFTAHALSLHRLSAYSLTKGCYPGQEIVARTHYLGRNKRQLVRFHTESPALLKPGQALNAPRSVESLGEVVLCGHDANRCVGLAVTVLSETEIKQKASETLAFELLGNP